MSMIYLIFLSLFLYGVVSSGKHAPEGVKILPLDLTSGEDSLREAVQKAESFFPDTGVDYMIHNAAFERPVSEIFSLVCETLTIFSY